MVHLQSHDVSYVFQCLKILEVPEYPDSEDRIGITSVGSDRSRQVGVYVDTKDVKVYIRKFERGPSIPSHPNLPEDKPFQTLRLTSSHFTGVCPVIASTALLSTPPEWRSGGRGDRGPSSLHGGNVNPPRYPGHDRSSNTRLHCISKNRTLYTNKHTLRGREGDTHKETVSHPD